jgi:PAS domain S-box-containing protein
MKNHEIEINGVPIQWDTDRGTFTFFGLSSALFWINPSLLTMLQPLAKEVGVDLFRLMVAHSSSQGTEEDYHAMVTVLSDSFEEGFLKWGEAVSSAGWGIFSMPHYDMEARRARVRVENTWEVLMQKDVLDKWGCPFIQGKIIGIFNHAFDTTCWADEVTAAYGPDNFFVEFDIYESPRTIDDEIDRLRLNRLNESEKLLAEQVRLKANELHKEVQERIKIETKFRTLFESSSDAIMLLDENGFFDCNQATLNLFGCPDVKSFSKLHPSELSPLVQADGQPSKQASQNQIEIAFQSGKNFFEWTHWRYDNHHEFPAEVLLNVLSFGDKEILQAVVRDVSRRKNAEQLIVESKEEAEAASRVKSEFLANMSHEIRTPMNAVLGMAKIGIRDSVDDESKGVFRNILDSGQHLLGIINDILDFSKIEAGKLNIETHPFQLSSMVEDVINMVRDRAMKKGIELSISIADNLPAWLEGDPLRLHQILLNIVSNAVKFTPQGKVLVSVTKEGDMIHFRVQDHGVGLSEEHMSRLFTPFEQADKTTTRKFGGTGLGLSISYNLAQLMGGDISVESELNRGSVFTLKVNLPETKISSIKDVANRNKLGPQLKGVRILIAEDVEINRLIIEDLLESEGASIVFAEDGLQAVDRFKQLGIENIDIILMDIQMPIMDGYEATRHIHKLAPDLPVIGVTAHALKEDYDKCYAAGMVGHISKPIEDDKLITAILDNLEL